MNRYLKNYLSKINFLLNRNPIIEKSGHWKNFIPNNYSAVLTITADFELAWAPRYSKTFNNPLTHSLGLARKERLNIPLILQLCDNFDIPITWATVGHLFLTNCNRIKGVAHSEIPKIKSYNGPYWAFKGNDWFEFDPCTNYKENPEWYAPDLIEKILNSKVKHEIGCHTFSHIDCREEVCSSELFNAEISECKNEALKFDLVLKSFVHPGHTIGNLDNLSKLGFSSYQTDPGNILGYPKKYKNSLWELKRTYEFVWRAGWSVDYHIYRYKKIIERAIKNHSVCNFWFHPSFNKKFLTVIMPEIFKFISENSDSIYISTVGNYVSWLNEKF